MTPDDVVARIDATTGERRRTLPITEPNRVPALPTTARHVPRRAALSD